MYKETRRNLIKGLAVGAPVAWAKPVVDSVVLPAHAETSCQICFTITVTGTDGTGDDGGGGFEIFDPNVGCSVIREDRYDGDAGTQETICVSLPAGEYGLLMTAGSADGALASISVQCCSASETLGPTDGDSSSYDLVIGGDSGPCSIDDEPSICV